jgi:DNA-binding beta-propeller fold protein YncE
MKTYSAIIRSLALIINVFALTVGVSPHARAAGKQLLVGNAADNSVSSYDGTTGVFLQIFVPSGSGGLDTPQDLTIGPDGNLYVSSWANHSVKRYDGQTGAFIDDFVPSRSGGLANPDQVVFGPDGKLYVSSRFNATISRYDGQTGAFGSCRPSGGKAWPITIRREHSTRSSAPQRAAGLPIHPSCGA